MKRPLLAFALSLVLPGAGLWHVGRRGWAVANLLAVVATCGAAALALPEGVFARDAWLLGLCGPLSGGLAWDAAYRHNQRHEADRLSAWQRDCAAAAGVPSGPGSASSAGDS